MDVRELQVLMAEVAPVIADYVELAVTPLRSRIARLEAELADSLAAFDVSRLAAEVEHRLPVPLAGKDGRDGTDADPEAIAGMVARSVETFAEGFTEGFIASLPPPMPGKDGAAGADGRDGRDAPSLEEIGAIIRSAVDALPPPRDGRDGTDADPVLISEMVQRAVENAIAALPEPPPGPPGRDGAVDMEAVSRIAQEAVERRIVSLLPGEPGPQGPPGRDGESIRGERGADGVGLASAVMDRQGNLMLSLTDGRMLDIGLIVGRDGAAGRDGHDGTDADVESIGAQIDARLSKAIAALPAPERGEPGAPGEPGPAGRDGMDAVVDEEAIVARTLALMPPPERGERGLPGERGERGLSGEPGPAGIGVAGAMIDRSGALAITLSDGTIRQLGVVIGRDGRDIDMVEVARQITAEIAKIPVPRDGKDGTDGVDGVGFDDLQFEQLDDRSAVVRFVRGERAREFPVRIAGLVDRGVWKDGQRYLKGDATTWGGSLFIAQTDDPTGKPELSQDWRLATKRGRDGRDGKDGKAGDRGPEGRPGRDGYLAT